MNKLIETTQFNNQAGTAIVISHFDLENAMRRGRFIRSTEVHRVLNNIGQSLVRFFSFLKV